MFNITKKQSQLISQLDNAPISTVIGSDITFKGDISAGQAIKIDGQVIGNIHIDNGIILGEKAIVDGNLKSGSIILYGTLNGNIECKELIIKSTGNVCGDINTQVIEIEMGGKYNGLLSMNPQLVVSKNDNNNTKIT